MDKIVFTNEKELSKYNELLLNEFITYLNNKHKKTHNVFNCGANVQIISREELIKEFNDFVISKIVERG